LASDPKGSGAFPGSEEETTMSSQSLFFAERCDTERKLAEDATLTNVRENHLRAAAAWEALASRSVKGDRLRAEEQRRKDETSAG
jgi:hypothetical protein